MEIKNQIPIGTWDKLGTEEYNSEDKVKFEVNITQPVKFLQFNPDERTGMDGGVYYQWKVNVDGKDKILQTSAWTLLKELKKANLKVGSILNITKRLVKGKQFFEVK